MHRLTIDIAHHINSTDRIFVVVVLVLVVMAMQGLCAVVVMVSVVAVMVVVLTYVRHDPVYLIQGNWHRAGVDKCS